MISVCIATYNGEKYVKEQVSSILKQLSENDEIIISDDNSTDRTLEILASFQDARIKVFHHEKDLSLKKYHASSFLFASYNFENAIKHANGDVIYLADQDDIWADNRIEETLYLLDSYDYIMCNFSLINKDGIICREHVLKHDPVKNNVLWNTWKVPFRGCCMAFRKDVLLEALPLPQKCIIGHDNAIGITLLHKGYKYKFVDKPLQLYRTHDANVSPVLEKSTNKFWFKVNYRLRFLRQLYLNR
jgi:glycosyltransferase involved in cell wall biosynthesis